MSAIKIFESPDYFSKFLMGFFSLQDFQPTWSWSTTTNVTDRQTDEIWSEDRALHYSASRGKNRSFNMGVYGIMLLILNLIKT